MRALRSRTVGNSSSMSDATINKSVTKKKTRSRKSKPPTSENTLESSDTDSVFNKSTNLNEVNIKSLKKSRKTRKTKNKNNTESDTQSTQSSENECKTYSDSNDKKIQNSPKLNASSLKKKKEKKSIINETDLTEHYDSPSKCVNNITFDETDLNKSKNVDISMKSVTQSTQSSENECKTYSDNNDKKIQNSLKLNASSLKKKKEKKSIINETDLTEHYESPSKCVNNITFDETDLNKSKNVDISMKSVSRLSDTQKFKILVNDCTMNLDNESFPEDLVTSKTSSSSESLNKTLTYDPNCILIDDSIDVIKAEHLPNDTFEKSSSNLLQIGKNTTFDKNGTFNKNNSTFEKVTTSFTEKCPEEPSRRDTYQISNGSGQWSIEDIYKDYLNETKNDSVDIVHLHRKSNIQNNILNDTTDTPNKSVRKKWVKFDTDNVVDSPILQNSTFFGTKVAYSSTPFEKKFPVTPARLNKSLHSGKKNNSINKINSTSKNIKKSVTKVNVNSNLTPARINKSLQSGRDSDIVHLHSTSKSNKKSAIKAKAMPNFALIHQRANDKKESLQDYSERKKERAVKLLSGEKPGSDKENHKNNVVKSTVDLFGNTELKKEAGTPKKLTMQSVSKIESNKKDTKTPKPQIIVVQRKEFVSKLPHLKSYQTKNTEKFLSKNKEDNNQSKNIATPSEPKINVVKNILKSNQSTNKIKTNLSFKSKLSAIKPKINHDNKSKIELSFQTHKQPGIKVLNKTAPIISKAHIIINKPKPVTVEPKVEPKPVSVFSKGHCMAVANKTKTTDKLGNRDNRRDQIKGVRSNRRFDLLMQMRSNM